SPGTAPSRVQSARQRGSAYQPGRSIAGPGGTFTLCVGSKPGRTEPFGVKNCAIYNVTSGTTCIASNARVEQSACVGEVQGAMYRCIGRPGGGHRFTWQHTRSDGMLT